MIRLIKKTVNGSLALAGLKLVRRNAATDPEKQLSAGLRCHGVTLVFDVGANKGQFASRLFKAGYQGRIVSIEPLSDAHAKLAIAAHNNSNWIVAERCVIGERAGETTINVSKNSVSSSVMPILDLSMEMVADTGYVAAEKVSMRTLDSIAERFVSPGEVVFVKMDTQGFEWNVIEGGLNTLANAVGVLCEVSLVPLYEGQRLWSDVTTRLETLGFRLWAMQPEFSDPKTGRALQMNALFFRPVEHSAGMSKADAHS